MQQTETQILRDIFNVSRLMYNTAEWGCISNLHICTKATCADECLYGPHQHGEDCIPDYDALAFKIPSTEVRFASALANFIGTSTLVYIAALDEWQVMDAGVYRALAGDWFIHKAIKTYARKFNKWMDKLDDLAKDMLAAKTTHFTEDDKEKERRFTDEFWKDHNKEFGSAKKLSDKLGTERGIHAITVLMKSELNEIPQSYGDNGFSNLADFMSESIEPGLVEGLITDRGLGQIFGPAYRGKTYTAVDLVCSVAAGLDTWMGRPINVDGPQEVLYIAAEGGDPIRKMFQGWKAAHPKADLSGVSIRDGASGSSLTLSDKALPPGVYGLEDLKTEYQKRGKHPRLILIDPQANVTPGVDENSTALAHALKPLQDWANEEGIFVMLVHHTGKNTENGARGSSAQGALMDVQIQFKDGQGNERAMDFLKVKGEPKPDAEVKIEFVEIDTPLGKRAFIRHMGKLPSWAEKIEDSKFLLRAKILAKIGDGKISGSSIAESIEGTNRNVVREHLKALEAEGVIVNKGPLSHPRWALVDA